ncbi:hypothetical protein [Rothia nasimurium]|uniref:hypothetical protein n=1 Tax=Rothia nasimurium TaxID=85336 RepID=UPI003B9EBD0E
MNQRSRNLARAWMIATSATGLGVASHLLGGGHLPHPLVLALATALAALITLGMTKLKLPRLSLGAGVLTGQGLLHILYSYGHPVSLPSGHRGHLHGELATSLQAVSLDGHSYGVGMWLAHGLASVITYALLAYGEELAHALKALLSYARRLLEVPSLPVLEPGRKVRGVGGVLRILADTLTRGTRTSRGPPSHLAYR